MSSAGVPTIFSQAKTAQWGRKLAGGAVIGVALLLALLAPSARAQNSSGQVVLAPVIYSVGGLYGSNDIFNTPEGVAVDNAGNVYVADTFNNLVWKIDPAGTASKVAGEGSGACGAGGGYSGDGGAATGAELNCPTGVTVDAAGNLYIADSGNNRVRKVNTAGIISTVAGIGTAGYSGDGGLATNAGLSAGAVALDASGNLYIADFRNNRIRKVNTSGAISTAAGNGTAGFSGDGGAATSAELNLPQGLAVDSSGNLYIADTGNNLVRKVNASGIINVVAGDGIPGYSGDGGTATSAELNQPIGVALDSAGNIYIGDSQNASVRKVDISGKISTVAGNGIPLSLENNDVDGEAATNSVLNNPYAVVLDKAGNIYIADSDDDSIRKVSTISTLTATALGSTAASQNILIQLTAASAISSITVPKAQNNAQECKVGTVTGCVTDGVTSNAAGTVCTVPITFTPQYPGTRTCALTVNNGSTIFGTVGLVGTATGPLVVFEPGSATVLDVGLKGPQSAAIDSAGDVYIADTGNSRVVEVTAAGAANVLLNVGTPGGSGLSYPQGVVVDGAGDVYIADTGNNRVVEVTAAGVASVLSTGSLTVDPQGVAVDSAGNLYIADAHSVADVVTSRVVEVTATGVASVLSTGSLTLNYPYGLAVDGAGDVYIADSGNDRVVEVTAAGVASVLSTGSLTLVSPDDVSVDGAEDVYIADSGNDRVVEVTAAGVASVLSTSNLTLGFPYGATVDGAGNVYIADSGNDRVVKVDRAQQSLSFPNTAVGATSAAQTVTLANIGNQPLDISSLTAATDFPLQSASTCTGTDTLAPGSSCTLAYAFLPTTAGTLAETATVTDNTLNGTNAQQTILFSGTATPPIVTLAATTTALATSNANINQGSSVTFTATITSGASGTPTGTVTFLAGTTTLGTGTLSGAKATYTTSSLAAGAYTITAQYGGDSSFAASTSAAVTETVTAASPIVLSTVANPTTITIAGGGTGDVGLTTTVDPSFTGNITFSCSPSSPKLTCILSPTSWKTTGASDYVTDLSINAYVLNTSDLRTPAKPFRGSFMLVYSAMALWLPGSFLALFGLRRKGHGKHMRKIVMLVLLCAGIASVGSLTGCGSVQSLQKEISCAQKGGCADNTPAGSYTVAVTSSDGTTKSTTTVNVTVQ